MSNDLISQDVLLAEFRKQAEKCENFHISAIETEIESAHAVDAVEVVRCKECKKRVIDMNKEKYECGLLEYACYDTPAFYCKDNDFCSYGERKDGVK